MNSYAPSIRTVAAHASSQVGAPSRGPVTSSGVRLTRRGRLAIFALAFVVAAVLAVAWSSSSVATPDRRTEVVVVQSGDTLWEIARGADSDAPISEVVSDIRELNDLDSAEVMAGQRLVVPV